MSHYSSLESLSLPKRGRVFDTQLVPAGDALPIWKKMSLDTKLPVVPSPRGSYTLYTTKVSIQLSWKWCILIVRILIVMMMMMMMMIMMMMMMIMIIIMMMMMMMRRRRSRRRRWRRRRRRGGGGGR
jgi:hypothetical protein